MKQDRDVLLALTLLAGLDGFFILTMLGDGWMLGMMLFINLLLVPNLLFADQIIGSLVRRDVEDLKKGLVWTPLGKRKIKQSS